MSSRPEASAEQSKDRPNLINVAVDANNKYAIKIQEMLTGADQSWLGARHVT